MNKRYAHLILVVSMIAVKCDLVSSQYVDSKEMIYQVKGPIEIDTSIRWSKDAIYEKYLLKVKRVKKRIYIPVQENRDEYIVSSYMAAKEINPDSFLTAGSVVDYYDTKAKCLEVNEAYEIPFFLQRFDFIPDTIFIYFKYYTDSLRTQDNFMSIKFTDYKPFPQSGQ